VCMSNKERKVVQLLFLRSLLIGNGKGNKESVAPAVRT